MNPDQATDSAAAGRQPYAMKTCVPTAVPMICPMKTCQKKAIIPVRRCSINEEREKKKKKKTSTHAEQNDGVHPRPRRLLDAEHGRRERHLLVLPEDVDPEAHDDDGGDAHAARARLHRLEDEQPDRRRDGGEPRRHEPVDRPSDERRDEHA